MMRIWVMEALAKAFGTFRGYSIEGVLASGNEVHTCTLGLMQDCAPRDCLESRGVLCQDVFLARTGVSVTGNLRTLAHLYRLMRKIRPDLVLAYQS